MRAMDHFVRLQVLGTLIDLRRVWKNQLTQEIPNPNVSLTIAAVHQDMCCLARNVLLNRDHKVGTLVGVACKPTF